MSLLGDIKRAIFDSWDQTNGGLDVNVQSQTNSLFQYLIVEEQKTDITLTSAISVDDLVVSVSADHGFSAPVDGSEYMIVRNGDVYFQLKVTGVSTNAITVEMPIDNDFPVEGTTIIRGNAHMNIDGDTTPTTFKFTMDGATTPIDINTIIITMNSGASVPDDGKFGGITALTNGMYIRKVDGSIINLGNYTTNQEFKDVGAIVEYTDKAPSGTNGTTITIKFEDVFGQVLRFDPKQDDSLIVYVRDDLSGLSTMTASLVGSYTSGE